VTFRQQLSPFTKNATVVAATSLIFKYILRLFVVLIVNS